MAELEQKIFEERICKYCVIFSADRGTCKEKHVTPKVLVTKSKSLNKYKDVRQICVGHAEKSYHKNAFSKAQDSKAIFESKSKDLVSQLCVGWRKQTKENRLRLTPMIEIVYHCGKQDNAFHGDNESGDLSSVEPPAMTVTSVRV